MQSVVVTGCSTGIGYGVTKVLIDHGIRVFGSVRRDADAEKLASAFGEKFFPLIFDVTDQDAVRRASRIVREKLNGVKLFGLVNNAGIAVPAPLLHQPIDDFRRQIEVNLIGQLIVLQAFTPLLGTDRTLQGNPGRIVNISSVGGKTGAPFLGAYAASKHALEGLSESLRRELMLYGIDVIIIGPGAIATPIWGKAKELDITKFSDTDYAPILEKVRDFMIGQGERGLPPEKIGTLVWRILTSNAPKVRYSIVPQKLINWTIPNLLPKRMVDKIIAGKLGFK